MRIRRSLIGALWFGLFAVASGRAQTVRGVVVDPADRGVSGVVVLMLDSASNVVARSLTNGTGEFRVATARPGSYRLRTLRIGYRPTISDPIALPSGGDVTRRVALSGVQVQLDTVRIVDRGSCRLTDDSSAAATFAVFEQARTALVAAQLTLAGRTINATTLAYERTLDPEGRRVMKQTSRLHTDYVAQPWRAITPDSVHRFGFVTTDRDNSLTYHAPSIDVLLSSTFVGDHCFRLVTDRQHAGLVGVAFEPSAERRGRPEIRGILWVERKSAELRELEYRYANVASEQEDAGAGGQLELSRLSNGAWAITRWSIRMPVLEQIVRTQSLGGTKIRVNEIQVNGGELVLAMMASRSGRDTLWARPPLSLNGVVVDSASGAPVNGSVVELAGSGLRGATDARGRFSIAGVLPGSYLAETRTPELESIGAVSQTTITFDDSTKSYEIRVPTAAQLAASLCPSRALGAGDGAIVGRVFQRGDTVPARGARVIAEWTVLAIESGRGNSVAREGRRVEGRSGSDGAYRLCGVPINTTISLTAATPSTISEPHGVRLSGRFQRVDLLLDRDAGGAATFAGAVLVDSLRTPIAGAEVAFPELSKTTVTDANGAFRVTDVPPGAQRLVVRRLGFGPLDTKITLDPGATVNKQIFLSRVQVLDSVVVTDRAVEIELREFDANRRVGLGHFYDRAQLAKLEGVKLSTLMAQLPGIALVRGTAGRAWVAGTRKGPALCKPSDHECFRANNVYIPEPFELGIGLTPGCYAQVYLDNVMMNRGFPTPPFDISTVQIDQIEALEWYAGPGETPMRYSVLNSAYGVLVLHTRRTP